MIIPGNLTAHRPGDADRIVVVGAGIAGLATALSLAPVPVTLVTTAALGGGEASTPWAQGGIAAALGADDIPRLHADDTLTAGAGLSEPDVALRVAEAAPGCIEALANWGVPFDLDLDGHLSLGLEAAHSRRRIVHAGRDGTGRAVLDALVRTVRATPSIEILEFVRAVELALDANGAVAGLHVASQEGATLIAARAVVLATGGLGGLYAYTTNPLGAVGSGLALAARAGAELRDLEFVQFHPTAMALGPDPMPLATEALRGEGAILINGAGERFMAGFPGAELAPRDQVARAIFAELERGQPVFLDAREAIGARFAERFPSVAGFCQAAGLDPATQPIPVRPAAHYHMGGILVDERGRSSVPGLWACGEVASTGLHGANRLASNSLLEGLAFASWIAADIAGRDGGAALKPVARPIRMQTDRRDPAKLTQTLRALMDNAVGVIRDRSGLTRAIETLRPLAASGASDPITERALVGLLIAEAALRREESRGAHFRRDFPTATAPAGIHSSSIVDKATQPL